MNHDQTPVNPTPPDAPNVPDALAQAIQGLDVDLSSLHKQAWLWAAPETCRFRTYPRQDGAPMGLRRLADDSPLDWLVREGEVQDPELSGSSLLAAKLLLMNLGQAMEAWRHRPLVWRIEDGVAQAVLLGEVRFTWSAASPEGRVDRRDAIQGWVPGSFDDLDLVLQLMGPMPSPLASYNPFLSDRPMPPELSLHGVIEQTGRHAQREQARRRAWVPGGQEAVSWWPWPVVRTLDAPDLVALRVRGRRGLDQFLRALQRLHPFWSTVRHALLRSLGPQQGEHRLSGALLGRLLRDWNAWAACVPEHPRAALLLPWALHLGIAPGMHAWRDDLWAALTGTPRSTWKTVRDGPLAVVKTALRNLMSLQALHLIVLLAPGPAPVPTQVLRQLPDDLWASAQAALDEHGQLAPAMKSWPMRRARAFLAAVQAREWTGQRVLLSDWLSASFQVLDWAISQDTCPLNDPSWTWATLVQRWLNDHQVPPAWAVPFQRCVYRTTHLSVVASEPEWRMLGATLHNCLKDGRSNGYRRRAREQEGVLVRMTGNGRSAVFIGWMEGAEPHWGVFEHRADHNQPASPHHQQVAQDVVGFLNATVTPQGFVADHLRQRKLTEWAKSHAASLDPLLHALDESWNVVEAPLPPWTRPLARGWAWLNHDRWWRPTRWLEAFPFARAVKIMLGLMMADLVMSLSDTPLQLGGEVTALVVIVLAVTGLTRG